MCSQYPEKRTMFTAPTGRETVFTVPEGRTMFTVPRERGCAHSTHRERDRVHSTQRERLCTQHPPGEKPCSQCLRQRLLTPSEGLHLLVLTGVDELHQDELLHVLVENVLQRPPPFFPQPRAEFLQENTGHENRHNTRAQRGCDAGCMG